MHYSSYRNNSAPSLHNLYLQADTSLCCMRIRWAITSSPAHSWFLPARNSLCKRLGLCWWCLAISIPSRAFLAVTSSKDTSGRKTRSLKAFKIFFTEPFTPQHPLSGFHLAVRLSVLLSLLPWFFCSLLSLCPLINNAALPNTIHTPAFATRSQLTFFTQITYCLSSLSSDPVLDDSLVLTAMLLQNTAHLLLPKQGASARFTSPVACCEDSTRETSLFT